MKYYTHITFGILLYTLFVWLLNQPFTVVGILFTAWISIMPDLIEKVISEHRSWGHSIIWLIPITATFFFNTQAGIAFASGFLGHILFDTITKKGVAFLYPYKNTRMIMPQKEKSRIQTGSKQEKALCLVVLLLLVPLAYGITHGMPDYGTLVNGNNSTLSKITGNNSTLGDLIKKITGNLKGNSSGYSGYKSSSNYTPYQKTSATDKTTAQVTPNSTKDDTSSLIDWLTDNPQSDDKQTNNNTNKTNSTNSTVDDLINLLDPLFDDLSGTNNTEQNITMEDDSADYIPNDYDPSSNPDLENWGEDGSDSGEGDNGNLFDYFFTIVPLIKVTS
jgi:membrane-bound metal-dependent hydrolase YbcI (DUF457 family)